MTGRRVFIHILGGSSEAGAQCAFRNTVLHHPQRGLLKICWNESLRLVSRAAQVQARLASASPGGPSRSPSPPARRPRPTPSPSPAPTSRQASPLPPALPAQNAISEPDVAIPLAGGHASALDASDASPALAPVVAPAAAPSMAAEAEPAKPAGRPNSFSSWISSRRATRSGDAESTVAAAPAPTAGEPERANSLSSDELAAAAASVEQELAGAWLLPSGC